MRRLRSVITSFSAVLLVLVCMGCTVHAHTVIRDIEYASVDDISLRLDLYLPEPASDSLLPLVIWVHGGGWRAGSKDKTYAPETLGEAYAVASVDYRLTGIETFPAQIHDVKAAVRWLRAHAADFGMDPDRFGAWGSSAGGHLVALLGVSCGHPDLEGTVGDHLEESSCVQAVCDFYGPTDLLSLLEQRGITTVRRPMAEDLLVGGPVEELEDLARLASPVTHIGPHAPPFLIMHGSEDSTVPIEQSIAFDAALQTAGVTTTLMIIDGAGHGFPRENLIHVKPFFDQWLMDHGESPQDSGDVAALHRSGQTFLTWSEDTGEYYAVFRDTTPFLALDDLTYQARLAVVAAGSSRNDHASDVERRDIFYIIEDGQPALTSSTGLLVFTAEEDAVAYYTVASCDANGEDLILIGSVGPVIERADVPQPIRQSVELIRDHNRVHYVHWAPHVDTAEAQALCNRPYYAFDFVVWEPTEPEVGGAALFSLHGGGGTYASTVPPPLHPELTVVSPESLIPGDLSDVDRSWDAWYGYNENVGLGLPLDEGINVDYTTRRLRWMAQWLPQAYPAIDANRIFLRGSSMGGVGTVFSSIMLRDIFAAGLAIVPRFDYGADDVFLESFDTFGTRWGSLEDNTATSDGMGVFDRLDAGYLARTYPEWDFAPVWAFNGRNDTAVGWSEKIPFYQAMNDTAHGWSFFWDLRAHGGQAPYPRAWRENGTEDGILDWMIANIRLDQSYPAFSNCSMDDDPGTGDPDAGDPVGTINGYLRWDSASLQDTSSLWSIELSLCSDAPYTSCTVDVTPRRIQSFLPVSGVDIVYTAVSAESGETQLSGTISPEGIPLVTIPTVTVTHTGVLLTLERRDPLPVSSN